MDSSGGVAAVNGGALDLDGYEFGLFTTRAQIWVIIVLKLIYWMKLVNYVL